MSTPYQTCGPDCPYWQPTCVSRCEGVCAITGELVQDGNACNVPDHGDEYQPDEQKADINGSRNGKGLRSRA